MYSFNHPMPLNRVNSNDKDENRYESSSPRIDDYFKLPGSSAIEPIPLRSLPPSLYENRNSVHKSDLKKNSPSQANSAVEVHVGMKRKERVGSNMLNSAQRTDIFGDLLKKIEPLTSSLDNEDTYENFKQSSSPLPVSDIPSMMENWSIAGLSPKSSSIDPVRSIASLGSDIPWQEHYQSHYVNVRIAPLGAPLLDYSAVLDLGSVNTSRNVLASPFFNCIEFSRESYTEESALMGILNEELLWIDEKPGYESTTDGNMNPTSVWSSLISGLFGFTKDQYFEKYPWLNYVHYDSDDEYFEDCDYDSVSLNSTRLCNEMFDGVFCSNVDIAVESSAIGKKRVNFVLKPFDYKG